MLPENGCKSELEASRPPMRILNRNGAAYHASPISSLQAQNSTIWSHAMLPCSVSEGNQRCFLAWADGATYFETGDLDISSDSAKSTNDETASSKMFGCRLALSHTAEATYKCSALRATASKQPPALQVSLERRACSRGRSVTFCASQAVVSPPRTTPPPPSQEPAAAAAAAGVGDGGAGPKLLQYGGGEYGGGGGEYGGGGGGYGGGGGGFERRTGFSREFRSGVTRPAGTFEGTFGGTYEGTIIRRSRVGTNAAGEPVFANVTSSMTYFTGGPAPPPASSLGGGRPSATPLSWAVAAGALLAWGACRPPR